MVQLNVTYDKKLKSKIFILKGEEGYARTTDVVADLISDFADCNTHFKYARVGLELDVLREIGKGFIYIYDNGNLIYEPIPWDSEHMDTIINSDWNDKGVYWTNNVLRIGTSDNTNSGLFIAYDVEHNIEVRFTGNEYCLGSKSDNIKFLMETPDLFVSGLELGFDSQMHHVDNVTGTIKYSSSTITQDKDVLIYDNGEYLKTVTLSSTAVTTLELGELTDGVHEIKAEFLGDDESTYVVTTVLINVGYQILSKMGNAVFIHGVDSIVNCEVDDYYGDAVADVTVTGVNLIDNEYVACSSSATPDSEFNITIDDYQFSDTYPNYLMAEFDDNGDTYTYYLELTNEVITVDSVVVNVTPSSKITSPNVGCTVTGYAVDNGATVSLSRIPFTIDIDGRKSTVYSNVNGTYSTVVTPKYYYDNATLKVTCGDASTTVQLENVLSYYSVGVTQFFLGLENIPSHLVQYYSSGLLIMPYSNQFNFKLPSTPAGRISLEFDVVGTSGTPELKYIGSTLNLCNASHVKIEENYLEGSASIYIDGNFADSVNSTSLFGFTGSGMIVLNNIKIKQPAGIS